MQLLNELWQHPTIELRIWTSVFLYLFFDQKNEKNHRKRNFSKTKMIWAVIPGLQICHPWFNPDNNPLKDWEIDFCSIFFISKIFEKKKKKSQKTQFLENQKNLSSHTWTPDLQLLNVPWQHPTIGWEIQARLVVYLFFLFLNFFEKKEKIIKSGISRKPKRFE